MILNKLAKGIKGFFTDESKTFIGVSTHDRDLGDIELAAVPRANMVWYRGRNTALSYPAMVFVHEADGRNVTYSNISNLKVELVVTHREFVTLFTHVSPSARKNIGAH